jgi:soluble lytic murein transglycosylase-like protein
LERIAPPSRQIVGPFPDSLLGAARNIALEHGLPPMLVKSIIRAESNGDPRAISRKGAMGLMQLMPETVKAYRVSDPFDPLANIRGGVQYLKDLLREFSGNLSLTLAAYNAGPGAMRKYQGIPPYSETQGFLQKIKNGYPIGEDPSSYSVFPAEKKQVRPMGEISGKIYIKGSPRDLSVFLKRSIHR